MNKKIFAAIEKKKEPITRDFFNNDVIFEEVMLPVKLIYYAENGNADNIFKYEYDAAGNKSKDQSYTYEYDYNPDGTYNSVFEYFRGKLTGKIFYDKNGYCVEMTSNGTTTNYEYEFDEAGRLIRKTEIHSDEKEGYEYTYDEMGRLYEEISNTAKHGCIRYRHEYIGNIENIYYFRNDLKEEKLWKIIEKDENGNIIKEEMDHGVISGTAYGYRNYEYKYDDLNRLVYEKSIYPEHFGLVTYNAEYLYDDKDRLVKKLITIENEDGENKLTYKTDEYFYNDDNGSMISKYSDMNGVITETEYAMIPKIVTGIEYKHYVDINP